MNSPNIRLLFLTAEPWPTFRADVAVLFGKWLPRHGVDSDLVTIQGTNAGSPVPWGGGRALVYPAPGGQARRRLTTMLHGVRQLIAVRTQDYDAIQVRDMPVLAALALLVARWKHLPFYYWMSYPIPEGQLALARQRGLAAGLMKFVYPWFSGWVGRFLLYRVVLPNCDHVFVQSPRMKASLVNRGINPRVMTSVPMGVDFDGVQFDDIVPATDPRIARRRVLVYLGALDRPRHIEVLFEMLDLLKRRVPAALLLIVGDTEDRVHLDWLHDFAKKVGVETDVIWTGWLPTLEVWRYLRVSEIGLSPVPRGPLLDVASPTKVPEYMMLRLPVVCNDNPDQADLIAASGAGRCVPYSAEQFAGAVQELLALDTASRLALGAAGREYVGRVRNYRQIAGNLATQYRVLLRDQGSTSSA